MYSIILPWYNEIDNLKLLIVEIKNILKNFDFEIIIIDDNSEDGTEQMIIENDFNELLETWNTTN